MSSWTFRYQGYDPEQESLREALCTLGNGYMATRGAAAESTADGTHYPGTYAAGVFNRLQSEISGRTISNESMVNLPNWLVLSLRVDGGAWFRIDDVETLDYVQELDLHDAVLTRRVRYRDGHDRTTSVTERRIVSMEYAHVCGLETTIVAENWSGRLEVRSMIDGAVENTLVERYRDLASRHLAVVARERLSEDSVLLQAETNQSHIRIAMAARTRMHRQRHPLDVERRVEEDDNSIGQRLAVDLSRGGSVTVEKLVTVYTSRDGAISEPAEQATRWLSRLDDFAALLDGHTRSWRHLWNRFRFEAEGSEESLRTLRLHLLHLLQTISPNSEDLDVGIPARGLHGEAYRGHVFWDELFVFPILNLRIPSLTRSLLGYRYRRLPEARHAARAEGHRGAMFPWQSGSDGREENQQIHLNPVSGRWNPDPTHLQRHIGIAIAYNVWQYYQVTDDSEFLTSDGAELLVDIALFLSSITSYDASRGRYVIRRVMGPDEFHTRYPDAVENGIDNNAYTNMMTVWVLLRAMDALEALCEGPRQELMEKLGVEPGDLERWQRICHEMYVPFHGDGIISQFEGYDDLDELDWDHYRRTYGDIHRLDRILEAEGDSPNRYKLSKQADVLMLFYLLSAEDLSELFAQLGYDLKAEMIPRNIDYYLERTSHGSTLSAVVHSWVLARAHRDRAAEFFEQALAADVTDIQGGTTPEGIHLAAMCGSVDLIQRCFAGLETREDRLLLNPRWPESLGTLTFQIQYRDVPLEVHITGETVHMTAGPGPDRVIKVGHRDEIVVLRAGSSVEFGHRHDEPSRPR